MSRRAVRPTRAIVQTFTATLTPCPLGCRLPRAADHERGCRDRHPGGDEITEALTLADRQHRICMKIHKSPPSDRDSLTSRTLGGLSDASRRQQRVWERQLAPRSDLEKCGAEPAPGLVP